MRSVYKLRESRGNENTWVKSVAEKGMEEAFKSRVGYGAFKMSAKRLAQSMISDAQEEMEFDPELARQTLNRVKWMLDNYVCAD